MEDSWKNYVANGLTNTTSTQQPLFLYGSLMEPQVLAALLGRVPETRDATLEGYHRYRIKDRPYPGIRPLQGAKVSGILMFGLTERERRIFDLFEGSDYDKVEVTATITSTAEVLPCSVYVWNLSAQDDFDLYGTWEFPQHFSSDIVPGYVAMCKEFIQEVIEEGLVPPS